MFSAVPSLECLQSRSHQLIMLVYRRILLPHIEQHYQFLKSLGEFYKLSSPVITESEVVLFISYCFEKYDCNIRGRYKLFY